MKLRQAILPCLFLIVAGHPPTANTNPKTLPLANVGGAIFAWR
jgi:hypothetical protein